MSFAENLNKICHERGTNLSNVLKRMGVSTSKVTLWNNGSLPKEDMLLRLAQELECSVMDFFRSEYDDMSAILSDDAHLHRRVFLTSDEVMENEDERYIIKFFRNISSKEKHIFMARIYDYEEAMLKREE